MASEGPLYPSTAVEDTGVGAFSWSNYGNVTADDTSYTTYSHNNLSTRQTYFIKATGFGHAIPAGATIDGIEQVWSRWMSTGNVGGGDRARDAAVRTVKGGTVQSGDKADTAANWPTSQAARTYGGAADLWSGTWTTADINGSGYGAALSVNLTCAAVVPTASVDYVTSTVYYTAGSPPPPPSPSGTPWLAGFTKRRAVTLPAPDATQTDFPVPVQLSSDATVGAAVRSDGADVRFTDSDGTTVLTHQRISWSGGGGAAATGVFRVKVPSVTTGGGTIYLYYGSGDATDTSSTSVWDSNCVRFFPLDEGSRSTAAGFYKDKTANAGNLTLTDADSGVGSVTGKVGTGIDLDGDANDKLSGSFSGLTTPVTVSFWVRNDAVTNSTLNYAVSLGQGTTQRASIWCGGSYAGDASIGANSIGWFDGTNVSSSADNTFTSASDQGVWRHVAVVYDNGASPKTRMYKDGTALSMKSNNFTGSLGTQDTIQLGLRVDGIFPLSGALDEVRISNTARSASWVKYEYQTESAALTLGSEELRPGPSPRRRSSLRTLRRM